MKITNLLGKQFNIKPETIKIKQRSYSDNYTTTRLVYDVTGKKSKRSNDEYVIQTYRSFCEAVGCTTSIYEEYEYGSDSIYLKDLGVDNGAIL